MARELLFSVTRKDFKFDYFSGTGAGGQHRNKHQNCVRLHHEPSGARTTGQSNRHRIANEREAFVSMVNHPKFKLWHNQKTVEMLSQESIEEKCIRMMEESNLRVEGKEKGKWVTMGNINDIDEIK